MIIIILGGIGSGKTLTAVKNIVDTRNFAFTNFRLKNLRGKYKRIEYSDVINKDEQNKKAVVNWGFWSDVKKNYKDYSIFLDEIHNIAHSRRSMSTTNILLSKWLSQIRKILQDSPTNHLFLISQTERKIDVDFKELAQVIISCKKFQVGKNVYIRNNYYNSMENYYANRRTLSKVFKGNKYFRFFDSTELVEFEDGETYL